MNHKRFLRHALALGLAAAGLAAGPDALAAQAAPPAPKHGDVNGDGVVSALDAQAILSAVVGIPLPGNFIIANGVANCDGRQTPGALDAQIVLSYVIGLNVSQYCVGTSFGTGATTVDISPKDSSLLINRGMQMKATLKDNNGFLIKRPIAWSSSNPSIVTIDSVKGDSLAFVKATANPGSSTITATSDGSSFITQLKVFLSYVGIVITPQRGDTIKQIGTTKIFSSKSRDSLGLITGNHNVTWAIDDTAIADISASTLIDATVIGKGLGTTFLRAQSQSTPGYKDSVPVTVALPPGNTCTAGTGSLHSTQTYTGPQTWTTATNPHFVNGFLTFNSGSSLTVQPGVLVCLNSGAGMTFRAGSRMMARGTVAQPIKFTSSTGFSWGTIQFGDVFFYSGVSTDTSVLTNALVELGGSGQPMLSGREQHMLVVDSLQLRSGVNGMVRVNGPGSRLSRSVLDTVTTGSTSPAAFVGRGTIEQTTIHNGANGSGIQITEAGVISTVNVVGGTQGIVLACCTGGAQVNGVTISGTTSTALDLQNSNLALASGNVQITGGTGGAFKGTIGNLGILFPDSLKQQTLKGNGKADSLFITGGTLTGTNLVVRPDTPWWVQNMITIDTLAQLIVRPGARIAFFNGGVIAQAGGTLDARGELGKPIRFAPAVPTQPFYGLRFDNPGQGPNPAQAPIATSQLAFVQLDSAQGQGAVGSSICCSAAINAGDRHRLLIDSAIVRKSQQGAVFLSAPGSELKRFLIDTTGAIQNNFAASYVAVGLGSGVLLQNGLVRRAGNVGVYVLGSGARMQNVRIVASTMVGLQADQGLVAGDLGSVKVDSANAYPFRGTIQNLAVLAPDSTAQANAFLLGAAAAPGNVDQVIEIVGGTLSGTTSLLTLTAIPQIRWQVTNSQPVIDTLGQLAPRPGARFTFSNSGFLFQRGGTLNAVGATGQRIVFQPVSGANANFYGLQFSNPGTGGLPPASAPVATSTLSYVQLDSASGQGYPGSGICCTSAAIYAGDHHKLLVDSLIVRKAHNAAVWMSTPGSQIVSSRIDTTGLLTNGYTTSQAAVGLGNGTTLQDTRVLRSGNVGVYVPGVGARLTNVRIAGSQGVGLNADGGTLIGDLGTVKADSANAYPFRGTIQNLAVLAPDSTTQANSFLLGASATPANTDQLIEITGGTLSGTTSLLTLTAIPQIRWQVSNAQLVIDTLGQLAPRPGARFTFFNSGFLFQHGGTLNAVGLASRRIVFQPVSGAPGNFYGLQFSNPGSGGLPPASAPIATSTLSYVQLDSAQGQGYPGSGICCASAAIYSGDHHKLLMDSLIVRKAHSAAVWMSTPGSQIVASRIDTTGLLTNGYTTSQAAVALGNGTTLQDTRVLRSGNVGVYAPGVGVRLTNVRIAGSQGVGLNADAGTLAGDLGTVKADSANAYPFRGTIQNLAVLAPDSIAQANSFLLGASATPANTDQVIEITGGSLVGTTSLLTLTAIPQIRMQVSNSQPVIDTLAQLAPRPGAMLTFYNAGFLFQRGGTINAVGTAAQPILFRPAATVANFYGLQFSNPGAGPFPPASAPIASSTMSYAQLDSAQGQGYPGSGICCASAAIYAGDHHQLTLANILVRKAHSAAIWMSTPGSSLTASRIDTTGLFNNGYITSQAAVALAGGTSVTSTTIRRSGNTGLFTVGTGIDLTGTRVVNSQNLGVQLSTGSSGGTFSSFAVDSTAGVGIAISANGVTVTNCDAHRGLSHGIATTAQYTGAVVSGCNIVGNAARAVNNFEPNTVAFVIDATSNWWGLLDFSGLPTVPAVGSTNGPSTNVITSAVAIRLPSGNPNP